jgi:ABC-type branched-subunit amino acid transport system permease subunit
MDYISHILILCLIYVIVAWSFDLLMGHLGVFCLCEAAFMGVGAYTYVLVSCQVVWGFSFPYLSEE